MNHKKNVDKMLKAGSNILLNDILNRFTHKLYSKQDAFNKHGIVGLFNTIEADNNYYDYYIYLNFSTETYTLVSFDVYSKKEEIFTKLLSLSELESLLFILVKDDFNYIDTNRDMFYQSETKFRVLENLAFKMYNLKMEK